MTRNHIKESEVIQFINEKLSINLRDDPFQQEYVSSIVAPTNKIQAVFTDAEAGTGKTSLAITSAYYLLQREVIDQIVYVRSAVSIREMGFLPGTIHEKEAPFMQPGLDALSKLDPKNPKLCETLIANKQLVIASTAYLRGVDWEGNKMLIIDEAQNFNLLELQTVLTRPHDSTKVVVIGSSVQCDIEKPETFQVDDDGDRVLPFVLYSHFFEHLTPVNTVNCKLVNNYRGKFSLYADKIREATKEKRFINNRENYHILNTDWKYKTINEDELAEQYTKVSRRKKA